MPARRSSLVIVIVGLLASSTVHAAPPSERPVPSEARRRGALEFTLGGVMLGVGVGLIAFGSIELVRAREHQRFCGMASGGAGLDPCLFDPPALGYAAVGLSWGFAVPILVGSGLLFARGARVLAHARGQPSRTSVAPWWNRAGGGVSLTLRF